MKRGSSSGVSQLELLIALALMGMMAVLLASALNFNRQALDRSRMITFQTETWVARDRLRKWVADMPLVYGTGTARDFLDGTSRSLRLQSIVTDGTFWAGSPAVFMIEVAQREGFDDLVISGQGRHPERDIPHTLKATLDTDIRNLELSYFGRVSEEAEARWHNRWSDPTFLPELVKIEWDGAEGQAIPPLTLIPGRTARQRYMSLSSLVPPG